MSVFRVGGKKLALFLASAALVPAAFTPELSHAGLSHLEGGTGLAMMQTADVLRSGSMDFSIYSWADSYKVLRKKKVDTIIMPSFTVGLWGNTELGLGAPYLMNDEFGSGVQFLKIYGKLRLLGGPDDRYSVAASLFGTAAEADPVETTVGSGESLSGARLLWSIHTRNTSTHLSLGSITTDRMDTSDPAGVRKFRMEKETEFGLGFEVRPRHDVVLGLEAVVTEDEAGDVNGFAGPTIKLAPTSSVNVTVGFAAGVPNGREPPDTRYFLGVSLGPNDPGSIGRGINYGYNAPTPESQQGGGLYRTGVASTQDAGPSGALGADGRAGNLANQPSAGTTTIAPVAVVADLDEGLSAEAEATTLPLLSPTEEADLDAMEAAYADYADCDGANAPPRCAIHIEVLNASGSRGLGLRVAKRLRQRGYNVIHTGTDSHPQVVSWVFYNSGYAGEAVRVGRLIPKDQIVTREKLELDEGVAIRVVVGADQR